jgi:hypothetical protein
MKFTGLCRDALESITIGHRAASSRKFQALSKKKIIVLETGN